MSKKYLRYLRNEVIEDITAQRIREYETKQNISPIDITTCWQRGPYEESWRTRE